MPDNSWSDPNPYNPAYDAEDELEALSALTVDLSDCEDLNTHYYRGLGGRRQKAAVALTVVWTSTIALHLFSWGYWLVLGISTLMGLHVLRVMFARPIPTPPPLDVDEDPQALPFVSLLVAAKNEESVIGPLVKTLCSLDYPSSRYELWIIDDHSTDRTPQVLQRLAKDYPQLRVVRRPADAGGGKSGALNDVWTKARGEIIGVFDADAQVPDDLLRRVLPLFSRQQVGAVQVRKAIAQAEDRSNPMASNLWIRGQATEMALDAYFQQQRIAIGGVGELRGNGQFVRREALERCGGWNEETITDDLDLTIRLHLDQWDIDFLLFPAVQEEGVVRVNSLWHQRSRWAEGGYQRYLDYWRFIVRNRMGTRKTLDLFAFWMIQYIVPTATVPDLMMAIARNTTPMLAPFTGLSMGLSLVGMLVGLQRVQKARKSRFQDNYTAYVYPSTPRIWMTLMQVIQGTLYMLHWFPVVASTTARISVRPKRLKWVKTVHHGSDDLWLDMPEQS